MRRDWLRCLHCGVPSPVTRPIGATLVQAAFLAFATTLATVGVVHAQTIWRFLDQGPFRFVGEAVVATVTSTGASTGAATSRAARGLKTEPTSPAWIAERASRLASSAQVPTVPLSTVAEHGSSATGLPPRCVASGRAERRLDDSTLARTVAACASVAALDSLEAQLHAAFPSDPALQRGARALRRLEARRAQLTSPDSATTARDADAGAPSARPR